MTILDLKPKSTFDAQRFFPTLPNAGSILGSAFMEKTLTVGRNGAAQLWWIAVLRINIPGWWKSLVMPLDEFPCNPW